MGRAESLVSDVADRNGEERRRIAVNYQSMGEYGRAVGILDGLTRRYPAEGAFYSDKGLCEYLMGQPDAAIADLLTAIRLKPEFIPAYLTLGAIHTAQGRYALALKLYDEGLARSPAGEASPLRAALRAERQIILSKAGMLN